MKTGQSGDILWKCGSVFSEFMAIFEVALNQSLNWHFRLKRIHNVEHDAFWLKFGTLQSNWLPPFTRTANWWDTVWIFGIFLGSEPKCCMSKSNDRHLCQRNLPPAPHSLKTVQGQNYEKVLRNAIGKTATKKANPPPEEWSILGTPSITVVGSNRHGPEWGSNGDEWGLHAHPNCPSRSGFWFRSVSCHCHTSGVRERPRSISNRGSALFPPPLPPP